MYRPHVIDRLAGVHVKVCAPSTNLVRALRLAFARKGRVVRRSSRPRAPARRVLLRCARAADMSVPAAAA
jgi:hypothetical protein